MNEQNLRVYGLLLAAYAELEGMKADNANREQSGESMAWDRASFYEKADEIRDIVTKLFH